MVAINTTPVRQGETNSTIYTGVATTTSTEYTFSSVQSTLFITNNGYQRMTVTISGVKSYVKPNQSVRYTADTDRFTIKSDYGSHPFQVEGRSNIGDASGVDLSSITTDPTFNASIGTESVQFGAELIDSTGWTATGWTGDFTNGFIHTIGQTAPLRRTIPTTGIKLYQLSFRVESPSPAGPANASTDFTVSIGNSTPFITYRGGGNFDYAWGIRSISDGDLVITPGSSFDGTIKNISVKEITGIISPSLTVNNKEGFSIFQIRTTQRDLLNTFMGRESGSNNTTGERNISIGHSSMVDNTSGYWNTAIGNETLQKNTVGSRNVAAGRLALQNNISGHRNIALGTFALNRNTHGANNIGIGADTLWVNTTGDNNIALCTGALAGNTTGQSNIAIGLGAVSSNATGSHKIGIGMNALYSSTGDYGDIALGFSSSFNATTGRSNVAVGSNTLKNNVTGSHNVALGEGAGTGAVGASITGNTLIGKNTGIALSTGGNNVMMGYLAGSAATTGAGNVILGQNAGNNVTTGSFNILIGLGANAPAFDSTNKLNIGNAIYGDTGQQKIGIGVVSPTAFLHLKAGAATVNQSALKFSVGALLTSPETGAFEFDGTNLYFTINNVRKTVQVV